MEIHQSSGVLTKTHTRNALPREGLIMRTTLPGIHRFFVLLLVALAVAGCTATPGTSPFETLTEMGVAYADRMPVLIDKSFDVAVTVDSETLIEARDNLSEAERRASLAEFDQAMKARLGTYADLKRHTHLLKSYFLAFKSLSKLDAVPGIRTAAKNMTSELGKISPGLKALTIGSASVKGLIAPSVNLVVGSFKSSALRSELEARGGMIERELALQEALVQAIAEQVRADQANQSLRYCRDNVVEPYVGTGKLRQGWPKRRLRCLRSTTDVDMAQAAEAAIRSLRMAYIAAAENHIEYSHVADLVTTVQRFVELVSRFTEEKKEN